MTPARIVIDTNVIVSGLLFPESIPRQALTKATRSYVVVLNLSLIQELKQVLIRGKFDRYVGAPVRLAYLHEFVEAATIVPTIIEITACRDPRDNHVLEAAINGAADTIVTGDEDLLALNPFHDIHILTPTDYLKY